MVVDHEMMVVDHEMVDHEMVDHEMMVISSHGWLGQIDHPIRKRHVKS